MGDFENKRTTKKGAIGEKLVHQLLRNAGFVIYRPEGGQAHPFDNLAIKLKKTLIIAEVKSKSLRKFMPDTGMNVSNYEEYKFIMNAHNLEVIMFFVDEESGLIYGGKLSYLEQKEIYEHNGKQYLYPLIETTKQGKEIIYFHKDRMQRYAEITQSDIDKLVMFTDKSEEYKEGGVEKK